MVSVPAGLLTRLEPDRNGLRKTQSPLRAAGARTYEPLWRAVGNICELFDPREFWNFLKHAGHASD